METGRSPSRLAGKVALLTGADAGLCRALADALKTEGAVPFVAGSVTAPASAWACAAPFDAAERAHGGVDIAIHVLAPLDEPTPLTELSLDQYDAIADALVKAPFFLLQQAARRVRDGGKVLVALAGTRNDAAHAGAAAAVQVFARVLTREIGARGITVNLVSAPAEAHEQGFTDLIRAVAFMAGPDGRWINAQTVRTSVLRASASAGDNA
ncbi:SDR family oxidoreductase [Paraburkholderia phosphatilytica]|uniref:SDR family oxidoreductase n=1 Tax=Paraburkholderia phosphatilytica TaxID=2282883 RepID=UPI000E491D49|nr:SDR family oxidoreductase [Paraburkholderia phosphatilytica]